MEKSFASEFNPRNSSSAALGDLPPKRLVSELDFVQRAHFNQHPSVAKLPGFIPFQSLFINSFPQSLNALLAALLRHSHDLYTSTLLSSAMINSRSHGVSDAKIPW
jgi:hypothetical protein